MTREKKLPKMSRGLMAWYEKLCRMAHHSEPKIPAPLLELIENVEKPTTPHLNPSEMTLSQTEKVFGMKAANFVQIWPDPSVPVTLPADLDHWKASYDEFTENSPFTEAKSRPRVDALLVAVYRSLSNQGLLRNAAGTRVTLAMEHPFKWGVLQDASPQECSGTADYSLFFGDRNHMACHLVIVEAKRRGSIADQGQLLAYMGMVQASRKKRGQSDYAVWGVFTDGWIFDFYQLNMDSEWSTRRLQATQEGWQTVASMLGSIVLRAQAACASPLRLSVSSTQLSNSPISPTSPTTEPTILCTQPAISPNRMSISPRISSMHFEPMTFPADLQDAMDFNQ